MDDPRFDHDGFRLDQLIRPVANLYKVSALAPGDEAGAPVAFVRQKKLAIREDLRFFADESEGEELFRVKARQVMDVGGRYDVTTPAGERIGVLQRRLAQTLLRTTWAILDADETALAEVTESSMARGILRRVVDIPILYHFSILVEGRQVGEVRRILTLRDRYVMTLGGDVERRIDRRLAVALLVVLDALQAR
jgi:uncharacterized protein YxjI